MEFKEGDRVVAKGKNKNNIYTGTVTDVYAEYLFVLRDGGVRSWLCKRLPSGHFATAGGAWDNESILAHEVDTIEGNIKVGNNKNMSSLIQKFKVMTAREPEKTFIKAGVMNEQFQMTADGQQLFNEFLVQKFKEEFKTEIVDKIVEEDAKK